MAESIVNLLHRRPDLSTFLVHLTRTTDAPARTNLISIVAGQQLEARRVLGMGSKLATRDAEFAATQRVVCFTETPLEHVWMMCQDIELRSLSFDPYGLAVTKTWARRRGVNPVWYLDITRGHDWLTVPINELLDIAERGGATSLDRRTGDINRVSPARSPVARIAPFIEQMGNPSGIRKEFWWEREWRHVGNVFFNWFDLVAVFAPEADHESFMEDLGVERARHGRPFEPELIHLLDPRWGLERMIAALAQVDRRDVGPFPA